MWMIISTDESGHQVFLVGRERHTAKILHTGPAPDEYPAPGDRCGCVYFERNEAAVKKQWRKRVVSRRLAGNRDSERNLGRRENLEVFLATFGIPHGLGRILGGPDLGGKSLGNRRQKTGSCSSLSSISEAVRVMSYRCIWFPHRHQCRDESCADHMYSAYRPHST